MDKCIWILDGDEWKTQCGHFIKDDDTCYDWAFCPWCGEPTKEGENDETR